MTPLPLPLPRRDAIAAGDAVIGIRTRLLAALAHQSIKTASPASHRSEGPKNRRTEGPNERSSEKKNL